MTMIAARSCDTSWRTTSVAGSCRSSRSGSPRDSATFLETIDYDRENQRAVVGSPAPDSVRDDRVRAEVDEALSADPAGALEALAVKYYALGARASPVQQRALAEQASRAHPDAELAWLMMADAPSLRTRRAKAAPPPQPIAGGSEPFEGSESSDGRLAQQTALALAPNDPEVLIRMAFIKASNNACGRPEQPLGRRGGGRADSGALGMAADAVFHQLAYQMTAPVLRRRRCSPSCSRCRPPSSRPTSHCCWPRRGSARARVASGVAQGSGSADCCWHRRSRSRWACLPYEGSVFQGGWSC